MFDEPGLLPPAHMRLTQSHSGSKVQNTTIIDKTPLKAFQGVEYKKKAQIENNISQNTQRKHCRTLSVLLAYLRVKRDF